MVFLIICAFLAGFVDSIVGGGGLIQLPALFVFLPAEVAAQVPIVLGINKFSSICGTAVATLQYLRRVRLQWRVVLPAVIGAFAFSFFGARAVTVLNPEFVKPIILALLVAVALYTFLRGGAKVKPEARVAPRFYTIVSFVVGACIGFYDGFFGPGTGTFLIISFVTLFGFDFLIASASAKVVNLSTNIAAIAWFAGTGNINYYYAVPMALANVAGAAIGSHLAILKGSEFVRRFFIGVVLVLIARFAYELAIDR
jgi:uncharacterized membrane protein YfcA